MRERKRPDRLHVVHLCAPAGVGGLERVVQGLTTGLDSRGHRVTLIVVTSPGVDLTDLLAPIRRSGVRVMALHPRGGTGLREVLEIRAVRRALREIRPDVLHTHGYRSDLLHGWHARLDGIATVSTLHGSSRMGGLSHAFEYAQLRALRDFDAVIPVSAPLGAMLRGVGVRSERMHMIPNAWTPPEEPLKRSDARSMLQLDGSDAELTIGWVGRLIPIKGCDVFLEALARVRASGWDARVVGDGPERAPLQDQASRLGLSDRVRFVGAVPDAARYLEAFDLFVLSSRSEGTPMVLLEAMGAGLPTIATRVGGVPDMLPSPDGGWIVPSEDPRSLARAIERAIRSESLRRARAELSLRRVRDSFNLEQWVDRHEAVYRDAAVVRGRHRGGSW